MKLAFSVKKRLLPLSSDKNKKRRFEDKPSLIPLKSIGYDAMINVIKFLDGESKYHLAHCDQLYCCLFNSNT